MANPTLEIKGLTKKFGGTTAIKNLSLHVHAGEIYGLIGPNGSGKTTTLKTVAGLYRPTKGTVKVSGLDIIESPTKAKAVIGYIPDDPSAYDKLTGREFLQFVGELYGMERGSRDEKIESLLSSYHLQTLADGYFDRYSRGTKQKISILAALLHAPALLLIDEPMVGLDPESAKITKQLFRDFAQRGGSILMSTHTLSVAEEICHRFGVLVEGRIVADGRLASLRQEAGLERGDLESCYLRLARTV
jgi:ABC-2 type transport system ATP-binding protein